MIEIDVKDKGYYEAAVIIHNKIFDLTGAHPSIVADIDDNNSLVVSFKNNNGKIESLKTNWDCDFDSDEVEEFYVSYIEVLTEVIDKISKPENKSIYKSTLNIFKK